MLETAVEDDLIRRNPCRIGGAGQEESEQRPVIPLAALTRDRLDLANCQVQITDAKCECWSWPEARRCPRVTPADRR